MRRNKDWQYGDNHPFYYRWAAYAIVAGLVVRLMWWLIELIRG